MKNLFIALVVAVMAMFVTSCSNDESSVENNISKLYGEWVQVDNCEDGKGEFELRTITVTINSNNTYYWKDVEDGYIEEEFAGTWEYLQDLNVIVLKWTSEDNDDYGYDYCHVSPDFKSFKISFDAITSEPQKIPFVKQ